MRKLILYFVFSCMQSILSENTQWIGEYRIIKLKTKWKLVFLQLTVAVKKFNPNDLLKDFSINREIKHTHLIHYFGLMIQADQSIMLVMEYANYKSLYDCLTATNSKFEYSVLILLDFIKQILSALTYFEKKLIVHKNISIRNYLVFSKSLVRIHVSFSVLFYATIQCLN